MLSSTRNEDMQINQNINNLSSIEYDQPYIGCCEIPCSESIITCYKSKVELKCLKDPIGSRVTLVSIYHLISH